MKRVCVIGAGAAGLCMARHLTARKDLFITSVFEQTGKVGGTWVYTDQVGTDENGLPIHSSMYKNLRTNLPKEIMAFPDFPFPSHLSSFTHHSAVQKYLEDYSDYFNLVNNIQFNSHITLVKSIQDNGDNTLWKVTVKNLRTSEEMEHIFDAVIVCNGHYSVPLIPKIPGLDDFPGFVVHSHEYRHPEDYKDLDIVLLGAGSSGKDIAVEIAQFARHVYLSHNSDVVTCKLPENLEQVKGIETVDADSYVHLIDGNKQRVDGIMFCTGYKYSFPFLAPECGITANDGHVTSLYKHVFNTKFPSMAFIGIPCHVCPFPQFHFQSSLVVSVLSGKNLSHPKVKWNNR